MLGEHRWHVGAHPENRTRPAPHLHPAVRLDAEPNRLSLQRPLSLAQRTQRHRRWKNSHRVGNRQQIRVAVRPVQHNCVRPDAHRTSHHLYRVTGLHLEALLELHSQRIAGRRRDSESDALRGERYDTASVREQLRTAPSAHKFFDPDFTDAPEADFYLCTDVDRFGFALQLEGRQSASPWLRSVS